MRIWFISAYDAPKGSSSRTYDYAKVLIERGHEVTFFTSGFDHFTRQERLNRGERFREEWIDGIRVLWLKTIPYYRSTFMRFVNMLSNAWRAYTLGKALKNEHPDVIVGPSVPLFTGMAAYSLSKSKDCSFCFEVRDIWPQALIDLGVLSGHSPVTWGLKKIEKFLYKRASHIIAVLPFAYRHIITYGVSKEKITWIPNGVNFDRFVGCQTYNGGSKHSLKVMYVGGYSTTHSVETIIRAAKLIEEKQLEDNISFTIVGGGLKNNEIRRLGNDFGLKTVEFIDFVEKAAIAGFLEKADVLIASVKDTPVYRFGINSNKIFDYLASGRPVIFAGNSPNNPVKDAGAGFSVPPENPELLADAIIRTSRMAPVDRSEMGKRGLVYAREHYDTRKLAVKLEYIFTSIIKKSH